MPGFGLPQRTSSRSIALITETGADLSYQDLHRLISQVRRALSRPDKALVAVFGDRDLDSVAGYLACLIEGHACGLFGELPAEAQRSLVQAYQPEFVIRAHLDESCWLCRGDYTVTGQLPGGTPLHTRRRPSQGGISEDLALLLTTSGSTGSAKVARLSGASLEADAAGIVETMNLDEAHRSIMSLPLSHGYGLKVFNSAIAGSASVVVTSAKILSTQFWRSVARHEVTHFAAVPGGYELLSSRGVDLTRYPSLVSLEQSGGRLADHLIRHYAELIERNGGGFWVAYGSTEAGRISCLPAGDCLSRIGSVGRVVSRGKTSIHDERGAEVADGTAGLITFSGPTAMLGYADSRADLARGDAMAGRVETGDIGYLDNGYLYLTGRAKRIVKALGYRIDLDHIETVFAAIGRAAVVRGAGEQIVVFVEDCGPEHQDKCWQLTAQLGLPPGALLLRQVDAIPVSRAGKPDYVTLAGYLSA